MQPGEAEAPGQTDVSALAWCCSHSWGAPLAAWVGWASSCKIHWHGEFALNGVLGALPLLSHIWNLSCFPLEMGETPSGSWLGCSLIQFCCDLSFLLKSGLGTLFCYWDFTNKCSLIVSLPELSVFSSLQKAVALTCVGQLGPKPFLVLPELMYQNPKVTNVT